MYEVEVKVRAAHDRVRERLDNLDAVHEATVEQVDTYYDAPHRDFAETDEALRLREVRPRTESTDADPSEATADSDTARTELAYKGPRIDDETKTREEHETRVDDGEPVDAALRGLGFDPAHVVEKERRRYSLRGYVVTLDRVRGLGEFVEVEREVPETAVEEARQGAIDLLEDLGLDPEDGIATSYLGLLLADDEAASRE